MHIHTVGAPCPSSVAMQGGRSACHTVASLSMAVQLCGMWVNAGHPVQGCPIPKARGASAATPAGGTYRAWQIRSRASYVLSNVVMFLWQP